MPEQIFRDLTPDLSDVPDTAWDVDPTLAYDALLAAVPAELRIKAQRQGLIAVAAAARLKPPSATTRERLKDEAPQVLAILDDEQRIQDLDYDT